MDATKSMLAWQPLTPRGVAAFASAPLRRLLLVQLVVALLVGLAAAWFCYDAYVPVISKTVARLPETGEIRNQQLHWQGDSPVLLAENRFLALNVDLEQSRQIQSLTHVQIEFGRTNFLVPSLFGYLSVNYPQGWIVAANRTELIPLWGAWQPATMVGIVIGAAAAVMVSWSLLALLYAGPVRFYCFFLNRDLSWFGAWKMSGMAALPGALILIIGPSCYDLGLMDLLQLAFVYLAHFVVGWIYLLISPPFLPGAAAAKARANPFASKAKS